MTRFSNLFFLFLFAAFCAAGTSTAYAAATITCGTNGDFNSGGAITTQATGSGVHNLTINTAGAISYDAAITGPATGTPITCTMAGWRNNSAMTPQCDISRVTQSTGGCCGTTTRNHTLFRIKGVGNTTLAETNCLGMGTNIATFNSSGTGTGTLTFGTTLDATHVTIGGTYKLSNNAAGVLNLQIRGRNAANTTVTVTATADYSVLFASSLGITSTTDMALAKVIYASGSLSGADHVDLGTNGTAVYAGTFSAGTGTKAAGQVTMNNVQNGVTIQVQCDTTVKMTNAAGTSSITINGIKVAAEGSTGTYAGAGAACNGSGGAAATTMVYTAGTADQFFFGGKLDGATATSFTSGSYDSRNPSGTSMTIIVLNQ